MSVIYCSAIDDYVDTDWVLPYQHAFELHPSAEDCCEDGRHDFRPNRWGNVACNKCGMPEADLNEWLAEERA